MIAPPKTPATTPPAIAPVLLVEFFVTVLVTAAEGPDAVWEAAPAPGTVVGVALMLVVRGVTLPPAMVVAALVPFLLVFVDDEAAAVERLAAVDVGLKFVVWPFLSTQTPAPLLQQFCAPAPAPQQ